MEKTFILNDLSLQDVQTIFNGLLELPGKQTYTTCRKIEFQINSQVSEEDIAAMAKPVEPVLAPVVTPIVEEAEVISPS